MQKQQRTEKPKQTKVRPAKPNLRIVKRDEKPAIKKHPKIDQFLNRIITGDCIEVMRQLPRESVDLVVTSPPYNLKNSTGNGMKAGTKTGRWANNPLQNGYAAHGDNMPHNEYVKWQRDCLKQMMRVLKPNGAIFYNHKWRVQGGLLQDRADILKGFPVRQIIIWQRAGGFNFNPGYFVPTYEVIYMITKPEFKLAEGANAYGDVWTFKQEMKNPHPAAFPAALIERVIASTKAQIILDPFMGSGTTAIAAMKLNRDYIGIELAPEYVELAQKRILQGNLSFTLPANPTPEENTCLILDKGEKESDY